MVRNFLLLFILSVSFTPSLRAQACDFKSDVISLGGASHDPGLGRNNSGKSVTTLSNGNFVIGWSTDDGIDGDQAGAYFQVFSEDGTAVSTVAVPYAEINPNGTGEQSVGGPIVVALNTGFVIGWVSEDGPGDTGPVGDDQKDALVRVYDNAGAPISAAIRISATAEEDLLSYILPLSSGGFAVVSRTDKDANNKDDCYFQTFNASGASLSGGLVNFSGGAHDNAYQTVNTEQPIIELANGDLAVAWGAWDDADGDDKGSFLRIFKPDGTPVTGITIPYTDINAAGTGDQGSPSPRLLSLANGNFLMAWVSEQGPGDTGPGNNDDQDVYFRVYQSNGTAVSGSTKANSDNAAEEESLSGLIALTGGNFSILYRTDEDEVGNKDDFFVRTFSPTGTAVSSSIEVSGGAHTEAFGNTQGNRGFTALNNGNFVVGWSAWGSVDGDSTGSFIRVFDATGMALSTVITPYADINPGGTGPQSTSGPLITALPAGFAVAWQSADGPTDVGPGNERDYDVYHRVYDNMGSPLCGSKKTNTGADADEDLLEELHPLMNGDFVVMYRDEERLTGNKDDFFARVIGGAPAVNVCPTIGELSFSSTCQGQPFSITVSGLDNMAEADNGEQDYGITFYALLSIDDPAGLYGDGFGQIGSVPFSALSDDGTSATFSVPENLIGYVDVNPLIIAILDATPTDAECRPFSSATRQVNTKPSVSLAAPGNFCLDAGPQANLGNVAPAGGTFSGPGITDDANGSTYSLDPATAGVGTHELTYTFTSGESCTFTETRTFQVFPAPTVAFTAPEDLDADAGVQTGLSGGTPGQGTTAGDMGVYSGPGVTDDGNGMTYSFDPAAAGVGVHTITYTYTDGNGCSASASDDIEVKSVVVCPTIGEMTITPVCQGESYTITVTGLENMAQASNGERDYGIAFYAFLSADVSTVYSIGGTSFATVPFSELGDGGTTATLVVSDENLIRITESNPLIIAILDATPTDDGCRPGLELRREFTAKPFVDLVAPGNFCADAGVQTGLGTVMPAGGVFSGPGITDDGNGSTYSLDLATAGVGTHELTYTFTTGESCTFTETRTFEVFLAPTVTFTAPADLGEDAGVQSGLGGGTPVQGTAGGDQGVYSGPGVTDDGNGMTYSFDPAAAGVGVHTITYMYTDANGCAASSSDDIEVSMQIPPGNTCADANDINTLFGQAIDEAQLSDVWDNTSYTTDPSDPATGTDCFFDASQNPIWFTFTGDGNRYRISTTTDSLDNPIPEGDTQLAIYTGACGSLTPLACSEDEDEGAGLFNASLELDTEAGVVYSVLIDGVASSLGNGLGAFQVEVTQLMVVNVTNIEETPITLFPNPTTGILHWQNINPERVQVFDYTGKLLLSDQQPTTELNISALPAGFYLIRIEEGSEVYSAKVVKE